MPIKPDQMKLYPGGSITSQLWRDIKAWVRLRSGDRCEGSPAYPNCRAKNGEPHPITGSIVVLTVAHVNHDLSRNGPEDLRHWCQLCHNTHDAPMRAENRKKTAAEKQIEDDARKEETTARLRSEVEGVSRRSAQTCGGQTPR